MISLSDKSIEIIERLKEKTTAESDSAVFRDALRLYWVLVQGHESGTKLFVRKDGKEEEVSLFAEVQEH